MKILSFLSLVLIILALLQGCALIPDTYTAQDYREDYTGHIK